MEAPTSPQQIVFEPPAELARNSNIQRFMNQHGIPTYGELIRRSADDPAWFWDAASRDLQIEWFQEYETILDTSRGLPWARWFVGGKCNMVYNCLDKHMKTQRRNKLAYVWEGEDGAVRRLTYFDLYSQANRLANALQTLGVGKGEVVGIYMPMVPEAIVAMLACNKIGAVHNVVFSGFSAPALATRLVDAGAKVLFTADGYFRRGVRRDLKKEADLAVDRAPTVQRTIVYQRLAGDVPWHSDRDVWYHEIIQGQSEECPCEIMDADDPLYILYTSGTTGRPKGAVIPHGGYPVQAAVQTAYLLDLKDEDVLFWPADIGWITGQTWSVYGPLILGGTVLIYEGAPDYPAPDRWWSLVEKHGVTLFGASPTAIRLSMKHGEEWVRKHNLRRVRLLASTGEPLNPEPWLWYFRVIGGGRCPVINLSGGTEISGGIVSPLPILPLKPSTVGGPIPGFDADIVDEAGRPVRGRLGYLVVKKPWPGMTQGLWRDPERYLETYWSQIKDVWWHGDWGLIDEDGYWYLHGRVDDTIKVAGHRVGTAEIEAALISHPSVAEAAVVGLPHDIKGEGLVACVVLKLGVAGNVELQEALKERVAADVGKWAWPEEIRFVSDLPKTRTGKILRRLIKLRLQGKTDLGDLSGLENPQSLEALTPGR